MSLGILSPLAVGRMIRSQELLSFTHSACVYAAHQIGQSTSAMLYTLIAPPTTAQSGVILFNRYADLRLDR